MASPAPPLFVREDIAKPENRLNLALFALFNVRAFRRWFLSRLDLPVGAVIYPPQNVNRVRPDFVVVDGEQQVLRWIEVELGPPDEGQLADYRSRLDEDVVCIAGGGAPDLDLDEVARAVSRIQPTLDSQRRYSAQAVLDLIRNAAGATSSASYADPDERLLREPLIAVLLERLPGVLIPGRPSPPPGSILLTTTTQRGWTLRAYSSLEPTYRSVSVMWNRAIGGGRTQVPAAAQLRKYLPHDEQAVESYVEWLREEFGADVSAIGDRQSLAVNESALLSRIDEFAEHLRALARAG